MSLALLLGTELTVDVEAGHEVFGISAPGPYVDRVESLGVTHVPVRSLTRSWAPTSDLAAFRELVRTIRSLELDVLHTHNPKTGVMGRIAGRLAGVPVVVNTCHGLWARPEDRLAKRVFVYGLEGLAARFSDYELFQNAADRDTLRPVLKRGRHRVVGNGVDLERFAPDPEGRRRVRAELGIADDELLVGTIGRRVREKGLAEFAEAANALAGKATFIWVGPDDDTDAETHVPHEDAVRFVGERTDMPAVYSALDVFVLASYREGFSRASMEAAACGTAMVLTDIRGCREVGQDGVHLLLAPPHDGAALGRAVERLLGDADLRSRLGVLARHRALADFDQRQVARVSLDTYSEVSRRKNAASQSTRPPRDRRITVLHVLPADLDRGAQVYAGQLRDALVNDPEQRHITVSLFAAPEGALRANIRLDTPSGRLRRVGFDPRAALRLRRTIRSEQAAVVVAHGGEPLKYVVAVAGRTPTVYYKIGLSSAELARRSRQCLYGFLARRASRVVGVSEAVLNQVHEAFRIPRSNITVIPNGRDPEIFYPPSTEDQRTDPPIVLFVGRLEPGKRPHLFLDVVHELRARGLRFGASIVGDGPLRASIEDRAATLDVDLLGVRNDVPDLMRRASVLVMTSALDTEGMPGVLVEAGLSGLPAVSTAAAGVSEVVRDQLTGHIELDDPVRLAERVEELLHDDQLRAGLGARGRERCEGQFSVSATARMWHDLASGSTSRIGKPISTPRRA
jgi:glycosyltransferase involved in cell wall biosynthesis